LRPFQRTSRKVRVTFDRYSGQQINLWQMSLS
jgi:hypothetical protein